MPDDVNEITRRRPWSPPLRPEGFHWEIPERFNIGAACMDAHPQDAPAIVVDRGDDPPEITTFGELGERARRLITFLPVSYTHLTLPTTRIV